MTTALDAAPRRQHRPRRRVRGHLGSGTKSTWRQRVNDDLQIGALLYPKRDYWRPQTRADCASVPRPCPYVGCRHHLYLEVSAARRSSLTFNFPDLEPWELEHSCSLDLAERGGLTIYQLAQIMDWGPPWASKLTTRAVGKVRHLAILQ